MTDKETNSAEELRQEKLMAARRKLKKFQSRKPEHIDGGDSDTSSHKNSYEEFRLDPNDVLVSSQGSINRSDEATTQMESLNSDRHTVHDLSLTSSPSSHPPPSATGTSLVSSPSSPPSSLGESSRHSNTSLSGGPANGQQYQILQHQIQTLQHEKYFITARLDELQEQWTKLNEQHSRAKIANDQKAACMDQQLDDSAEKYRVLEQQFLESTATCQSQHDKVINLQATLEVAQQQITLLTTRLSSADTEQPTDSKQTKGMENEHTAEPSQQEYGDAAVKLEETLSLAEKRQQQIDKLQTPDTIFHAETSPLTGMVNALEEKLTKKQVDNDTKNNDIFSQTDKDGAISTSIDSIRHLEQQHEATKQQLDLTKQQLDDNIQVINDLKDQMRHMEQERSVLKQQLYASEESVSMKDEELETASVDLGHLEQQYTSIKQTLDEKESLYTDLLKTKGEIEQQLQHTTERNQSMYMQHRQLVIDRLYHINQKVDQILSAHEKVEQKAMAMETKVNEQDLHWQHKQNEWDTKKAQHDNISRNFKTQEAELEVTRASLALAESQIKSQLDKLAEIEARSTEQQLYIRKLEMNQQTVEEQRQVLENHVETLQYELETKRELVDVAEKARSSLQEEHTAMQSRLESSHANLEAQQTLVDTLNSQLQSRTNQVGEMDAEIKALMKEKGDVFVERERKYQELESQLKDQTLKQQALEEEKDQQESSLKITKSTMEQLQRHASDLEQQLVSERTVITAANNKIKQQTEELEHIAQNDLLQQERDKRQEEVGSLSSQMVSLQGQLVELQDEARQHTQLYDDKVAALEASTRKHGDVERLLEQTRYWWMAEQTKVANMTEDVTQLRRQLQHNMNDRQKVQRQLDETKQLLANRDQNTEALQWQVTDMESSTQHQLDLLSQQLKNAHEEVAMKAKQVEQLQAQLSAVTAAATRATETIDQQNTTMSPLSSSPLTKPLPQSPSAINTELQSSEREQQMENEMKELHQRLERQYEAFSTIRDELTTVRDRQLNVELNASKEKDHLIREQKELELTINKLRTEYQDHLQRMWAQHQSTRHHHEEDLTLGRNALDAAQVKLMQNGLSPVSENGFDWMNTEDDEHEHNSNHNEHNSNHNHDSGIGTGGGTTSAATAIATPTTLRSVSTSKSPSLGILPPLEKPAFSEFLEAPRCGGCQTEVIDI